MERYRFTRAARNFQYLISWRTSWISFENRYTARIYTNEQTDANLNQYIVPAPPFALIATCFTTRDYTCFLCTHVYKHNARICVRKHVKCSAGTVWGLIRNINMDKLETSSPSRIPPSPPLPSPWRICMSADERRHPFRRISAALLSFLFNKAWI